MNILRFVPILVILFFFTPYSQSQTTYCNPIDIDYRYSLGEQDRNISYRAGADPVIVNHRGEYYLFVTNSGGWWHSKDLVHWNFVTPSIWPEEDMCAPAAVSSGDTLFLFQSTFEQRPIYFTTTPWNGHLEYYNRQMPPMPGALGPWDPDLFIDGATGKWFMYFGSSNLYPIYGIELDHNHQLAYTGTAQGLLHLQPEKHGWERFGQDHRDTIRPYIEGAWMTRHNGKYYLQYAAPGTEFNVYANGTYVGDHPLGPFSYAAYNPVSYKPGGFLTGAGHGNTFIDNAGNYWNTGTPWVAINWNFERRIAMFPAGFHPDGQMYADTRFGDFPHVIPSGRWKSTTELFTGWMLLSYRKPCFASSARDSFPASHVTDEDIRTFWVADSNTSGQWLIIDLEKTCLVRAVQVNYADSHSDVYRRDSTVVTQFRISESTDRIRWNRVADLSHERRDRPNAYLELARPVRTRFIRFEHIHVASRHLAISDIRVFGNGGGGPPRTPERPVVLRGVDQRNAVVTWKPLSGAVGYNILWGIAQGRLHECYQVFADRGISLELRGLNAGQQYYIAVEAFNEHGVSRQSPVTFVK